MSMKAIVWALHQQDLKPTEKIVLLMLSDRHNPDLGCFPSIKKMCQDCNMSRSSIFTHLTNLESKGLITRIGRIRADGQQTSNEYTLHMGVHNMEGESPEIGLGLVQKLDTNNHVINNHVIKPYHAKGNVLRSVDIGFDNFWNMYPRKLGKKKAREAYVKATANHGVDLINEACTDYAMSIDGKDPKFIPHASTWLNQERWDDDIEKTYNGIDKGLRDMITDLARVNR